MTIKTRNPGIYQTLIAQLDKTARHNRQGSFRTKERYYEAMQRFCKFLSEEYHLQKLANINGKHLTAYVLYMQEQRRVGGGTGAPTLRWGGSHLECPRVSPVSGTLHGGRV